MKTKLIIAAVMACSIYLFSCKKDQPSNNNPNTNTSLLSGKWYYMQDTVLEYKNGVLSQVINELSNSAIDPVYFVQLNSDGTGTSSNESGNVSFTYTVKDNKITFNYPAETIGGISQPAYSEQATLKILTSNRLELFYDDSITDNGNVIRDTEAAYYIKQ